MTIYCDSVIVIYLLDFTGSFQARAKARITALQNVGDRIAVSELTRLECRMKPIRLSDKKSLQQFDDFFARSDVELVPLNTAVFERATELRAATISRLSMHCTWRQLSNSAAAAF